MTCHSWSYGTTQINGSSFAGANLSSLCKVARPRSGGSLPLLIPLHSGTDLSPPAHPKMYPPHFWTATLYQPFKLTLVLGWCNPLHQSTCESAQMCFTAHKQGQCRGPAPAQHHVWIVPSIIYLAEWLYMEQTFAVTGFLI